MSERGSILITALWIVCIFSIMTASLVLHAGEEAMLTKRELSGFEGRTDFVSGLNEAVRFIQEDPFPHEDSKEKPYFGKLRLEGALAARLEAAMEDEEAKINLNYASATFLDTFLKKFEDEIKPLKNKRKDYVKGILKLRNEKRIESMDELLLIEDFDRGDLEALGSYMTVYPDLPLLNPNTASSFILRALIESLGGDHSAKQMLVSRLEEARSDGGLIFSSKDLNPEIFMEKLKLPKTPLLLSLAQEFVTALTTDSETFKINLKSTRGGQAVAIFRCRVGQSRPEVLWWHESL